MPVIISRTLELFVESLLKKTTKITNSRNARTLSPSHLKQCIISESKFDFLKDLVKNIPDISSVDEGGFDEPATSSSASNSNGKLKLKILLSAAVQLNSSFFVDHNNHQNMRQHLQRSQSYAGPQLSCLVQKPSYSSDTNQVSLKHKLPCNSNDRPLPFKISRLNSSPATSTITSSNYLNNENTTEATTAASSTSKHQFLTPPITPGSFKIEIKTPDTINHSNSSNSTNFPIQISYCIDSDNKNNNRNNTSSHKNSNHVSPANVPSTSSNSHLTMQPQVVKIDYSNLNLTTPMTSTTTCSGNSTAPLAPIKIDLSNFNPLTHLQQPQFLRNQHQNEDELDENYDDL